jgi:hypothetical protein
MFKILFETKINIIGMLIFERLPNGIHELCNAGRNLFAIGPVRFDFLGKYCSTNSTPAEMYSLLTLMISMIWMPTLLAAWSPGTLNAPLPRFETSCKTVFALSSAGDCQSCFVSVLRLPREMRALRVESCRFIFWSIAKVLLGQCDGRWETGGRERNAVHAVCMSPSFPATPQHAVG